VGLTRRLTQTQLQEDEQAGGVQTRFVAHFLAYAQAHAQPTPEDFNVLEAEHANLLAAMDRAYESGDWEVVTRLMWGLDDYLLVRGYWSECRRCLEQAIEAANEVKNEFDQAAFIEH
jgi:hypothetical protein